MLAGVSLGLLLGKPLGVVLACVLALRFKLATLPTGLTRRHLVVLGCVAGVGFTMAIFIAQLAFTDARLLASAKTGVLLASALASGLGLLLGRLLLAPQLAQDIAQSADEAESSTAH